MKKVLFLGGEDSLSCVQKMCPGFEIIRASNTDEARTALMSQDIGIIALGITGGHAAILRAEGERSIPMLERWVQAKPHLEAKITARLSKFGFGPPVN